MRAGVKITAKNLRLLMQITKEENNGLSHVFSVTLSAQEVDKHVEEELLSMGKKVKIPGFRPGKVPMKVLRQRYSKDVMGEVLERAINDATREVITGKKLRPALQPDIKVVKYEEGKDLEFDINLDVMPEIPEIKYDKVSINKYVFDLPEGEVEESLKRLAQSQKHMHDKDGKAENGDVVTIDFLGKIDGTAFAGGAGNGHQLELGAGQFIPGFEEQLIGTKAGDDVAVKVTFPKEYHSEELAGKDAVFDVKLHKVSTPHLPEINDELSTKMGFENLKALKGAVTQQLSADYERAARSKAKKELFDLLEAEIVFEIPEKMFILEFDNIWKQIEEGKKSGDPEIEGKSDEELKKEYTAIAQRRVRLGLVLSEIGRLNKIQIGQEELSAAVMQQARMYPGQEEKVFEFFRKNPKQVDELKGPILEEKAVDFILEKVKRVEVKVSIEELFADDTADASDTKSKAKKKPAAKKASAKKADAEKSDTKKAAAKKKAS
jgi:trigger factor